MITQHGLYSPNRYGLMLFHSEFQDRCGGILLSCKLHVLYNPEWVREFLERIRPDEPVPPQTVRHVYGWPLPQSQLVDSKPVPVRCFLRHLPVEKLLATPRILRLINLNISRMRSEMDAIMHICKIRLGKDVKITEIESRIVAIEWVPVPEPWINLRHCTNYKYSCYITHKSISITLLLLLWALVLARLIMFALYSRRTTSTTTKDHH